MALDVAEVESTPSLSRSKTSTPKLFDAKSSASSTPISKDDYALLSLSSFVSAFSWTDFSSLHQSLPDLPHIFDFSEINYATLNRQLYSAASSTPSWRCTLRGKDVMVFQRKFQHEIGLQEFRDCFYKICLCHHTSIIELLGISISGEYLYLVYNYVNGVNLSDCLRNSRSPNFTVLSTWTSRMQVATDLAHGLDYIHNKSGLNTSLTHNHIKSSSIIVTEPLFNARICHFGVAQLCNEHIEWNELKVEETSNSSYNYDANEISTDSNKKKQLKKEKQLQKSKKIQIKGARGYMAPEYKSSGVATPMTDVYAFGVVILELLSGDEPLKFKFDTSKGNFVRISLIESAMAVIRGDDDDEPQARLALEARLRRWVDRRLKDSFPIHVAEKLTRLAIQCVHVDPSKRPNMAHVATKISKLYLDSRIWSDNMAIPDNLSISLAPR